MIFYKESNQFKIQIEPTNIHNSEIREGLTMSIKMNSRCQAFYSDNTRDRRVNKAE